MSNALCFVSEARFVRNKKNQLYAIDAASGILLWQRYLADFDSVLVCARVLHVESWEGSPELLIEHPDIRFLDLPYYVGPMQYLRQASKICRVLAENCTDRYCYILRNGQLAMLLAGILRKRHIPYSVEMVGDPWDVFASGASRNLLRGFFRYWFLLKTKQLVRHAAAVLYVTQRSLQKRYPVCPGRPSFSVSDVMISAADYAEEPKRLPSPGAELRLICIGSLEQPYKAPDIVLKALRIVRDRGVNVSLTWLGDGRFKEEMLALADSLGIRSVVHFLGNVSPASKVRSCLRESDIFVMASRVEGLPRALVEAMSQGLPCIGTRIGGIPELLEPDVLIPANQEMALADKLTDFIRHPEATLEHARVNLAYSRNFEDTKLATMRRNFFQEVRNADGLPGK